MARKNRIMVGLCVAVAATLCAVAHGEKGEKNCSLPAAIESAVKTFFPNAVIEESKIEEEKMVMYEVKVKDGNKESEVKLAADGTIAEIETVEAIDALPAVVAQALKAQDAKVSKVEKVVEFAQLKLVKLDAPVTTYEAKISKDGKEIEIKVAADGTIIKQEAEKKKCDRENDNDEDD